MRPGKKFKFSQMIKWLPILVLLIIIIIILFNQKYSQSIYYAGEDISELQKLTAEECLKSAEKYKSNFILAVVCEPSTGEIVASCYVEKDSSGKFISNKRPMEIISKRCFEAGLLVYPIAVSIALENDILSITDSITCDNYNSNGIKIIDINPGGRLNPSGVLTNQSNIGIAKISDKLANLDLKQEFGRYGLNYEKKTDCEFVNLWGMKCNAMEIMQAYSVFANDGTFIPVKFINDTAFGRGANKRIIQYINKTHNIITFHNTSGTPGEIKAAGISSRVPSYLYTEDGRRYKSFYAGYAPLNKPKFLVFIMMDDPDGNMPLDKTTAGNVFNNLMQRILFI